jgi:hypothetical protein
MDSTSRTHGSSAAALVHVILGEHPADDPEPTDRRERVAPHRHHFPTETTVRATRSAATICAAAAASCRFSNMGRGRAGAREP